jgi:hypothetical protein
MEAVLGGGDWGCLKVCITGLGGHEDVLLEQVLC